MLVFIYMEYAYNDHFNQCRIQFIDTAPVFNTIVNYKTKNDIAAWHIETASKSSHSLTRSFVWPIFVLQLGADALLSQVYFLLFIHHIRLNSEESLALIECHHYQQIHIDNSSICMCKIYVPFQFSSPIQITKNANNHLNRWFWVFRGIWNCL